MATGQEAVKKVGVIGAGPAGLTAAYELSKAGVEVELFEAQDSVGGLSKSIKLWGQTVDLGPHRFFSSDPRVNALWLEVAGQDYELVDRLTRIFYQGRLFHYPLRLGNVLFNLGPLEAANCLFSYIKERIFPREPDGSFEDWVVSRFGRRLYEIFFKTYSEKLWGISGKELDADFAAQRIKKLSLVEAVKNAILQGRGNKHVTLVDQFAYPVQGTGMIYDRMAKRIQENGGKLHLKTPVKRVVTEGNRAVAIETEKFGRTDFDQVISTMPLTLMVRSLGDVPAEVVEACGKLRFRNTVLVYLRMDGRNLFDDNWLYVHSNAIRCGRITNFRNWVPSLYGDDPTTILVLEYWCNSEDDMWGWSEDELGRLARADIAESGLATGVECLDHKVVKINRCYPIYERGYNEQVDVVKNFLQTVPNLQAIGRYGSFKYNNQDHSILMGILAARNLTEGETNDLWDINTDYEYQERALITKTGLERI
jgi:protoporphyrinogen oxidase